MSLALNRIATGVSVVGVAALVLAACSYAAGARFNTTKSIPVGMYWTSNALVQKGAYVLWCPPQTYVFDEAKERNYIGAGFCPGGYGYMMKRVLAAKGDVLAVTDDGVSVNGVLLPHSKPIQADKSGRALPRYTLSDYTLGNDELLLMSDVYSTSFDARYFGPIKDSQIMTVISPVITW